MTTPSDIEPETNPENTESVAGAGCPASPCSAFNLGRLAELDRRRLAAEKLWEDARREAQRWANKESMQWRVAVEAGEEWMALKRELGLLPNKN